MTNGTSGHGGPGLWYAGIVLLVGGSSLMTLALGGAHPYVLLGVAPLCLLGCFGVLGSQRSVRGRRKSWPAPTIVLLGLAVYCVLQAVPIPLPVLAWLSPAAADVWANALHPFGQQMKWGALSLDKGASLREGLKWLLYGLNFFAAILLAERHGRRVPALVVFGIALAVALATAAHGLAGTTKVFGVYQPTFAVARWHAGPLLNPNNLSGFLNLGAFTGLGLVCSSRAGSKRWFLALGVATLFGVSVLSGSRGGVWLLPLGVALFVFLIRANPKAGGKPSASEGWLRQAPLMGALACGIIFAVLGATQATWQELLQENLEKLRIAGWALPLIEDYPVFGVGRGAFESAFAAYAPATANRVYSYPENFAVQWVSEWGIPVAAVAFAGLVWAFRPARVEVRGQSLGAGAFVGIALLLVQNLVDLGLELPATGLAFTWALAVVRSPVRKENARPRRGVRRKLAKAWPVPLCAGVLLWVATLHYGADDVGRQRSKLLETASGLEVSRPSELQKFWDQLLSAMGAHPAEPYFARLGGLISLASNDNKTLSWVHSALRRGINDARSHLLAARGLRRAGAVNQAFFELRHATELDRNVARYAGRLAGGWSHNLEQLERAAPNGPSGAVLLTAAAATFKPADPGQGHEQVLRSALSLDPNYYTARRKLAQHLLAELREGCNEGTICGKEALEQADKLMQLRPRAVDGVATKARMFQVLGRWDDAQVLLQRRCPTMEGLAHRKCLRAQLELARSRPDASAAEVSKLAVRLSKEPCSGPADCSRLYAWLGNVLIRNGDRYGALVQLERAAREEPTVPLLLKVADLAGQQGKYYRADRALARGYSLATPDERNLIRAKRDALRTAGSISQ